MYVVKDDMERVEVAEEDAREKVRWQYTISCGGAVKRRRRRPSVIEFISLAETLQLR